MKRSPFITTQDIRRRHPHGLNCDTDREYADFANRLVREMLQHPVSQTWSADYLLTVALKITLYFEDLVTEVGFWKSFVMKHQELYGKPLPFYTVDSDYNAEYPCAQDVLYLIWDAMLELQEDSLPNPENAGLSDLAGTLIHILEENFENIAINEQLHDFFYEACFCDDFYQLRQVLKWIYYDCYITSGRFTAYYDEHQQDFFRNTLGAGERDAHYGAECLMAFNQKIGPLALEPKEWMSLFLRIARQKDKVADVEALEATDVHPFLLQSYDKEKVVLTDWEDKDMTICRTDMFHVPERMLEDTETNGCLGSYAKYRGEWFLNGVNSWGDITQTMEKWKEKEHQMEKVGVSNYQHLMELSDGSPIFYFANFNELRKFLIEEMGFSEENYQNPPFKGKVKNIILFIPDEHGEMEFMFNNAESICDPRNPFYDRETAQKHALSIITNVEGVAGEFVRYAVSNNLLPDASLNSMYGEERGRELAQQNLDFLARTLRRQEF